MSYQTNIIGLPFSIKNPPKFLMCVMWVNGTGIDAIVTRYKLWQGIGENIFGEASLYSGQPIPSNFRLEIWSTGAGTINQQQALRLWTSVLQSVDYRFGTDGAICFDGGLVTQFSVSCNQNVPAFTSYGSLQARWQGSQNVVGNVGAPGGPFWVSVYPNLIYNLETPGFPIRPPIVTINDSSIFIQQVVVNTGLNIQSSTPTLPVQPNHQFYLCKIPAGITDILYQFQAGPTAMYCTITPNTASTVTLTLEDGNTKNVPANTWIIVEIAYNAGQSGINAYSLYGEPAAVIPSFAASATNTSGTHWFFLGQGTASGVEYADVLLYSAYIGQGNVQTLLNYLYGNYNFTFNLPLQFPANSAPQPN